MAVDREYKLINADTVFDFSEYAEFVNIVKAKLKNYKQFNRYTFTKFGEEILDEAVNRTPVDTGNLLSSWEDVKVSILDNDIILWFENSAYYASWVEYGHAKPYKGIGTPGSPDWVDGKFMLTVPLEEFMKELPSKYDKAFFNYMSKLQKRGDIVV